MTSESVLDIEGNADLAGIGKTADDEGFDVYLVGGAVRDILMGKKVNDLDITVIGDGIAFARKVKRKLKLGSLVEWKRFGTAELQMEEGKLEVATARTEQYHSDSRNPEVTPTDIGNDLARRDFTVNSIAVALNAGDFGQLIDPFEGRKDIEKKILRTPLDPLITYGDDPLRMLRAVRFTAQLGFDLHKESLEAIRSKRKRLSIVSQERITAELMRILKTEKPSVGFAALLGTGLLEVVLPELVPLIGVEQIGQHHHKDVFWHSLDVVDNVAAISDDVGLRFAALVHDIAKPVVKRFMEGKGWTFHGHEVLGVQMVEKLGRRLKLPVKRIELAKKMTSLHLRPIALAMDGVTDSAVRRLIVDTGDDITRLLTLCRADITSQNPEKVTRYMKNFDIVEERVNEVVEKDELRAFQSPVRGEEIMDVCGLEPGPAVGYIKSAIEQAILDGEILNDYNAAYDYLLRNKERLLEEAGGEAI